MCFTCYESHCEQLGLASRLQWREGRQPVLQYRVYIDVTAVFINEYIPHTEHYKELLIKELRTKEKLSLNFSR